MEHIYLHIGSNKGNRLNYLEKAVRLLESRLGHILTISSVYETEAWGVKAQRNFFNQALCIGSTLEPSQLLKAIKEIETELGGKKEYRWGPRCIDIDILFIGNRIINMTDLVVPHQHLTQRNFVMSPLSEIAESFIHPVFNKSIGSLLKECKDTSFAIVLQNASQY